MSKIGKKTIEIPEKVTIEVTDGGIYGNQVIKVSGPLGELTQDLRPGINVEVEGNVLTVTRKDDAKVTKSYHGLYRTLISNMINGVISGYEKKLEIQGVGYRGVQKGKGLELSLGFSHKVEYNPPENVDVKMIDDTNITVSGIDKQLVGQVAAEIRQLRKPEPYKGKGVRYLGEQVKRKAGKTAASK